MDYIDRTLIKLKRQYRKDETVSALIKKLKEKDVEIGKLNSEIDHLNEEFKFSSMHRRMKELAKLSMHKDEMYKTLLNQNKSHIKKIKKLRETNTILISKLTK